MSEIIQFNKTDDALFEIAKGRLKRGNFVGALEIFLELDNRDYPKVELYAEMATAYSKVPLYSTSCYFWFKFLALSKGKNNGYQPNRKLGYNFFRMGNHPLGALYYERSLDSDFDVENDEMINDDELYEDYIEDDIGLNNSEYFYLVYKLPKNSNFRVVDKLIGDGKMFDAMQLLLSVEESDDRYVDAQIRYATCLFIEKKIEEAIDTLIELQKKFPKDEYVLETLISSIFASSNHDRIKEFLPCVENIELTSVPLCYNVANYYCHLENYEKSLSLLNKALEIDKTDPDVHYFIALLYFNLNKFQQAFEHFGYCRKIYRDPIIDFYFEYCQKVIANEEQPKTLPYARDIPKEEVLLIKADASNVIANGRKFAMTLGSERLIYIGKYLIAVGNAFLEQYLCALARLKSAEIRKFVLSTLYNIAVSEKTKQIVIEKLVLSGFNNTIYFTFGGVFMASKICKASFPKQRKKFFDEAYACAVSHVIAIENENIDEISKGAVKLYEKLEKNGKLDEIGNDKNSLAVAMIVNSSVEIANKRGMLISFFQADKDRVETILQYARGRKKKNEDC